MQGTQLLDMPTNAQILDCQIQTVNITQHRATKGESIVLWALVDLTQPPEPVRINILGTGMPVESDITVGDYIATIQRADIGLVWHIFKSKVI